MSVELFHTMFEMQDSFNKKVHNEWRTQNFRWDIAIWVECGEMMDHLGYKWWKHQELDINQVILEMVDIWHFGMSYIMDTDVADIEVLAHYTNANYNKASAKEFNKKDFIKLSNTLVNKITDELPWFPSTIFFKMWRLLGLDIHDLYKMYIGKNALNEFRQLNGYKDGTYIKIWNGKEDNEVLTQILNGIAIDTNLYSNTLNELKKNYEKI